MRRVFLLLLLANLLYAGWTLLIARPAPPPPLPEAAPAYPAQLALSGEEAPAEERSAGGGELPLATQGAAVQEGPAPGGEPAGPAAPAEAPVVADAATVAVETAGSEVAAAPAPCVRTGPVGSAAAAERLKERVADWVADARVAAEQVPERSVFWVHIPPRASEAEAREVVKSLAQRGVESFVIRDEPALANGVSLGVFRDDESARSLQARMGAIGYPVEIHEERRTRTGWVVRGPLRAAAAGSDVPLPQGLLDAAAAAGAGTVVRDECAAAVAPGTAPD